MGATDDFIEGFAEFVRGGERALRAGGEIVDKAGRAFDRLSDGGTLRRVAEAGAVAAGAAVAEEVRAATSDRAGADGAPAARSRVAPSQGKCLGIRCVSHGVQPWNVWRNTLVCSAPGCGRIYQTQNPDGAHFAPAVCACGVRLLPAPPAPNGRVPDDGSARPMCSPCFDEAIDAGVDRVTCGPRPTPGAPEGGRS